MFEKLKTKMFVSMLVIALLAALVGGATAAWFTDTATNVARAFSAGTVNITSSRAGGEPIPGPMFYTTVAEGTMPSQNPQDVTNATGLWWPGRTVTRHLTVNNVGPLRVRLHRISAEITSINGLPPGANQALATSFANNMNVRIYEAITPVPPLYYGRLAALLVAPVPSVARPVLAANTGTRHLVYEVTMLSSAGNDLQGVHSVVSFSVHAEQTRNNP